MVLSLAWMGSNPRRFKGLLLLPLAPFLFEFPFHGLSIGGHLVNAASFLFAVLLAALRWETWHDLRRSRRGDGLSSHPDVNPA